MSTTASRPPAAHQEPFRSAWWLRNPHCSTMWGKFFRTPPVVESRVERWDTPDGDFLDVVRTPDTPGTPGSPGQPEAPTFLLLHGLEGSLRSHYTAGALLAAHNEGWQANLLVFRTCGGILNHAPRSYHSGETSDLDFVVERLREERPHSSLILAGVSLGANVLLKWLGEQGSAAVGKVSAAVAVSTPFDLARSSAHIDRGFSRLYAWNFLRSLKSKAIAKIRQHPHIADAARVERANTLWDFDDAFTSVVHGFIDAADYYYRSSSIRYLAGIRVPTLLLSARDDPFHPPQVLDDVARLSAANPALHLERTDHGGHGGFVEGAVPWRVRYYFERRLVAFAKDQLDGKTSPPAMEAPAVSR